MSETDRVQDTLREIVRLFQEAHRALTAAKCRVTAMAWFNLAQTKLDELERHPDPEVSRHIKEARAAVRAAVGKDKSLHRKLETYAGYWSQAL